MEERKTTLLIGANQPQAEGNYRTYALTDSDPRLLGTGLPEVCTGVARPGALPDVLYFTDERKTTEETPKGGGRVFAATLDREKGALRELNHAPSQGPNPSYCAVDGSGDHLLVTNFGDPSTWGDQPRDSSKPYLGNASIALFRLQKDGSLGPLLDTLDLEPQMREGQLHYSHAHFAAWAPGGEFFLVNDMGADEIDTVTIREERLSLSSLSRPLGSGPRYGAFHPSQRLYFVNYEETPRIESFRWDNGGALTLCHSLELLHEGGWSHGDKQSGFAIHPRGRWLYSAMRGKNLLLVIEASDEGQLRLVKELPLPGDKPKDVAVSPDGTWLSVACRSGDLTALYRLTEGGRSPTYAGVIPFPGAGCSLFV